MSKQKEVAVLTAEMAADWLVAGLRWREMTEPMKAIRDGLTTVIPTADLEAKDARIALLEAQLERVSRWVKAFGNAYDELALQVQETLAAIAGETK